MSFLPKKYRYKVTSQPRVEGVKRIPQGTLGLPDIRDAVLDDCLKHNCSPGFVIMSIVAKHYGIIEQADFRSFNRKTKRKRKGR
jgi:hypothetical protein